MKTKTSNLLNFAKGEKPRPPAIMVYFKVLDGKVYVHGAEILEHETKDTTIEQSSTRGDVEIFKTFDSTALIEQTRRQLIADQRTGTRTIKPIFDFKPMEPQPEPQQTTEQREPIFEPPPPTIEPPPPAPIQPLQYRRPVYRKTYI
jgi:hypothetical protein